MLSLTMQLKLDTDSDGVGDNGDAFPSDPTETADSDSDGVGDNADVFPNDASETADSDSDGVGDNADAFPTMQLKLQTRIVMVLGIMEMRSQAIL